MPAPAADDTLYLRLPPARRGGALPDDGYVWQIRAGNGELRQGGQGNWAAVAELLGRPVSESSLADAPEQPPGPQVVLLLPGEDVLLTSVQVPSRQRRQALRAMPFLVEDQLADDLESQHLVAGPFAAGDPVPVAAVARELLGGWQQRLRDIGLEPVAAIPDLLLLPTTDNCAGMALEADRCLLRTGAMAGLVVPVAVAADVVSTALSANQEDGAEAAGLQIWLCDPGADSNMLALSGLATQLATDDVKVLEMQPGLAAGSATEPAPTLLELMLTGPAAVGQLPLNLLCGDFAPRQDANSRAGAGWRSVAALAAGLVLVWLLGDVGRALWFDQAADALYEDAESQYAALVPGDASANGAVANLHRKLRLALGRSSGGTAGADALAVVGALAQQMGAGGGGNFQIRSLAWNGSRSELAVELAAPGFPELDGFRDRLAATGMGVDISSAEQVDNRVQARLRLRAGGDA